MTIIEVVEYICDGPECTTRMKEPVITTEDVTNEGCSTIRKGAIDFDVGGQHYCSFSCLFDHIEFELNSKPSKKRNK